MTDSTDVWYVRFPDGRVLRAASSAVVRRRLRAGRIPAGSLVRRSPLEKWQPLEGALGLAGPGRMDRQGASREQAARPTTADSTRDAAKLRLIAVRPLLDELLAALDSTLVRKKLAAAAFAGLILGGLLALSRYSFLPGFPAVLPCVLGAVAVVCVAALAAFLVRLTYVELAQLRPASWREGLHRVVPLTVQLAVAQGLVLGGLVGLSMLPRKLPSWLVFGAPAPWWAIVAEWAGRTGMVLGLLIESALWPLGVLVLLLGPVLVVEQCGLVRAVRQWVGLVRGDFGHVLLCEALALAIGALFTAPFALPLLVLLLQDPGPPFREATVVVRDVVAGLTLAPFLAYLTVANMFVYLHLRYEGGTRR